MPTPWRNWAGNVQAAPRVVVRPASLDELRAALAAAARRGETVRVAGAGHSFAPLCATDGTLLDLERLAGVERIDPATGWETVWAGTRINDLGAPLRRHDLRHTFAFHLAQATGADADELERRLGHRWQRYIRRYTNPPEEVATAYAEGVALRTAQRWV